MLPSSATVALFPVSEPENGASGIFDSGRGLLVRAKADAGRGGALRWCDDWPFDLVSVSCSRDALPKTRNAAETD